MSHDRSHDIRSNLAVLDRATSDDFTGVTRAIARTASGATERKGFSAANLLSDSALTYAMRQDWLAREAVEAPARDIVRAWWDIAIDAGDDDTNADLEQKFRDYLRDNRVKQHFRSALRWSRLYGGAGMFLGLDDGGLPEEPVNERNIRSIRWMRVVDRRYCHIIERVRDFEAPNAGQPLYYGISERHSGVYTSRVHHSRVLAFYGEPLPDDYTDEVDGWADSVLESRWNAISPVTVSRMNARIGGTG